MAQRGGAVAPFRGATCGGDTTATGPNVVVAAFVAAGGSAAVGSDGIELDTKPRARRRPPSRLPR